MTKQQRTEPVEGSPPVRDIPGTDNPTSQTPEMDQVVVLRDHQIGNHE